MYSAQCGNQLDFQRGASLGECVCVCAHMGKFIFFSWECGTISASSSPYYFIILWIYSRFTMLSVDGASQATNSYAKSSNCFFSSRFVASNCSTRFPMVRCSNMQIKCNKMEARSRKKITMNFAFAYPFQIQSIRWKMKKWHSSGGGDGGGGNDGVGECVTINILR